MQNRVNNMNIMICMVVRPENSSADLVEVDVCLFLVKHISFRLDAILVHIVPRYTWTSISQENDMHAGENLLNPNILTSCASKVLHSFSMVIRVDLDGSRCMKQEPRAPNIQTSTSKCNRNGYKRRCNHEQDNRIIERIRSHNWFVALYI